MSDSRYSCRMSACREPAILFFEFRTGIQGWYCENHANSVFKPQLIEDIFPAGAGHDRWRAVGWREEYNQAQIWIGKHYPMFHLGELVAIH